MWYDILVVCILLFFMAKGASRGLIWQLAGIAGIMLCVTFAGTASKLIGPHINLPAPQNQWAVMFITYLLATLVAFGFARTLNQWIDKLELKEFNRHLGAVFGLLKGALLVLIMTFMIVTFSENSRGLIKDSKAARIAAKVIHQLEPVIPDKLNNAVARYIDMFERTGFAQEQVAPGDEVLPELPDQGQVAPQDGVELGQSAPFDPVDMFGDSHSRTNGLPAVPPSAVSPDLLSELQATLGSRVTEMVADQLSQATPAVKARIEQSITDALQSADARSKRQLQQHVINQGQPDNLVQLLDDWAGNFLANQPVLPSQPPSNSAPTRTRSSQPVAAPRTQAPARQPTVTTQPSRNRTPVNPPAESQPPANAPRTILDEIVSAQNQFPTIQKRLKTEYQQVLQELPRQVGQAVFEDWYGDLTNSATDIDPATNSNSRLETRIQRQLNAANISIDSLPPAMRERMQNFGMTAEGAGVLR